jgi:7-cyano-7-deazaguanine synthase
MVETPMLHSKKRDIVEYGLASGVPFEKTRTCYKSEDTACGVCGSCQERLEAFSLNNAHDPIPYATRLLIPKAQ